MYRRYVQEELILIRQPSKQIRFSLLSTLEVKITTNIESKWVFFRCSSFLVFTSGLSFTNLTCNLCKVPTLVCFSIKNKVTFRRIWSRKAMRLISKLWLKCGRFEENYFIAAKGLSFARIMCVVASSSNVQHGFVAKQIIWMLFACWLPKCFCRFSRVAQPTPPKIRRMHRTKMGSFKYISISLETKRRATNKNTLRAIHISTWKNDGI